MINKVWAGLYSLSHNSRCPRSIFRSSSVLALQSRAWKLMFGEMPGTKLPWLWGFMRVRLLQEGCPGTG